MKYLLFFGENNFEKPEGFLVSYIHPLYINNNFNAYLIRSILANHNSIPYIVQDNKTHPDLGNCVESNGSMSSRFVHEISPNDVSNENIK